MEQNNELLEVTMEPVKAKSGKGLLIGAGIAVGAAAVAGVVAFFKKRNAGDETVEADCEEEYFDEDDAE